MNIKIPKKYLHDFIVYLQKTYDLYYVEFRESPNGAKDIVVANSLYSSTIWVNILANYSIFKSSVNIVTIPELSSQILCLYEDSSGIVTIFTLDLNIE